MTKSPGLNPQIDARDQVVNVLCKYDVKTQRRVLRYLANHYKPMTVLDTVRKILAEQMHIPVGQISGDSDLRTGVLSDLDSLDLIEIVMELEDHFEISIPDDAYQEHRTANDIAEAVCEKLKAGS